QLAYLLLATDGRPCLDPGRSSAPDDRALAGHGRPGRLPFGLGGQHIPQQSVVGGELVRPALDGPRYPDQRLDGSRRLSGGHGRSFVPCRSRCSGWRSRICPTFSDIATTAPNAAACTGLPCSCFFLRFSANAFLRRSHALQPIRVPGNSLRVSVGRLAALFDSPQKTRMRPPFRCLATDSGTPPCWRNTARCPVPPQ